MGLRTPKGHGVARQSFYNVIRNSPVGLNLVPDRHHSKIQVFALRRANCVQVVAQELFAAFDFLILNRSGAGWSGRPIQLSAARRI
jgi:hypothetical protein